MTKILTASEVKTHFYRLVDRVAIGDEIVVTKNGKATVAILSAKELSALKETLDVLSDPELMRQIRSSERDTRRGARRYTFQEIFGEPLSPSGRPRRRPR